MLDTTELTDAAERFADRLRAAPQSRLQKGAAAEALALARELSTRAQCIEDPGREPRIMPDAGVFAVADQVLVAANDLAEVLRSVPAASHMVDEAVTLVKATARRSGL
ncbi:hypothetical protein AB0903_14230 [Streptomyces sp. NPDC048389]|uniref:hypothetical protein n=1 Tax=Streptomyces sp. NPDC048389 TaxID=3154622 RepID=UPI00345666D2